MIINNKLILFGGILEVTKESDEIFTFDFTTQKWSISDLNAVGKDKEITSQREHENSMLGDKDASTKKEMQMTSSIKKSKQTQSMPNLLNNS